ncbi:conserved hypothetical protein [Burkholderiales bacterium 8X]|nr:conserved hypothetical protein [Burkholderiales bacterium 8X]
MTDNKITELRSFLDGYFHQDWDLEASEPDGAILNYLNSKPCSCEVERIIDYLHCCIDGPKSDAEIEHELHKLGCCYQPSAVGINVRDWLRHIVELLRSRELGNLQTAFSGLMK